jgi:hypothetical protein
MELQEHFGLDAVHHYDSGDYLPYGCVYMVLQEFWRPKCGWKCDVGSSSGIGKDIRKYIGLPEFDFSGGMI